MGERRRKKARKRVPDLEIEFVGAGVPDGPFCRIFKSATCRNFNAMLATKPLRQRLNIVHLCRMGGNEVLAKLRSNFSL